MMGLQHVDNDRRQLSPSVGPGAVKSTYMSKGPLTRKMSKSAVPWAGTSPTWKLLSTAKRLKRCLLNE